MSASTDQVRNHVVHDLTAPKQSIPTLGCTESPRIVCFVTPDGDPGFATRFGRRYLGRDRWRGWELCGIQNRRAGAALVAGEDRIRVRIVA